MIIRTIVNKLNIEPFDYFNDYHDTLSWLKGGLPNSDREKAIEKLEIGYKKWFKDKSIKEDL